MNESINQSIVGRCHGLPVTDAMEDEVKSLRSNKTWRLKKKALVTADGKRVLRGKWVFKFKRAADGSVQNYKARWVV
jgi:hypothetical protein